MGWKHDGTLGTTAQGRRRTSTKRMARRLLAVACTLGVAGWLVSAAAAHFSDVVATMDCSGATSYTATAWPGPTAASRTNADVRLYASYDGGVSFAQVGAGAFAAPAFSFSGSFSAGAAASVLVKVQEVANWGDGNAPGAPPSATALRPLNCTVMTPPVTPTPPVYLPARAGYCDAAGKFYDLEAGQDALPPFDVLHLRPADVNAATGALYCAEATPVAPAPVTPPVVAPPVVVPPVVAPAPVAPAPVASPTVAPKRVAPPKKVTAKVLGAKKGDRAREEDGREEGGSGPCREAREGRARG
jgi:hypothetical protein